ncbi:hypothetical protein ABVT39_016446 [Epinephelus coioides]
MDLRSRNKFPSQEKASERSLTAAEKTTESDHEEASMMAAMAQEHLSELNQSISGLKTTLDKLSSRVAETEERLGTAEDQLVELDSTVTKLRKENEFLMDKVDQLENYSRRNNIRVINLREGCEGNDPVNWTPASLGPGHFTEPLIIE